MGLQKPLISLGLGDVCRPALFSKAVIKEDEQDRDRGVHDKNTLVHGVRSDRSYTWVNCTHNKKSFLHSIKTHLSNALF